MQEGSKGKVHITLIKHKASKTHERDNILFYVFLNSALQFSC
jgi:hypothetical protein